MFERIGFPDPERVMRRYPHELSGGMRQRVMIAMALACDPKLLICDEPTTALDVTIQKQILELIKDLQKERNMAVLFITHDLAVIAEITDQVAVMCPGETLRHFGIGTGKDDDPEYVTSPEGSSAIGVSIPIWPKAPKPDAPLPPE